MNTWLLCFEFTELLCVLFYILCTRARYEDQMTKMLLMGIACSLAFDIFVLQRHRSVWVRNTLNVFAFLYVYEKLYRKHVIVVGRKFLAILLNLLP